MNPPAPGDRSRQDRTERGRTLVLGLGNPILKDDGVGIVVAREVARRLHDDPSTDVCEASLAGADLLDLLAGYPRAVLIDAIKTPGGTPGTVYRLLPKHLPVPDRIAAVHEIDLSTALVLGNRLGIDMPADVVIYAIEVENDRTFGEGLGSPVVDAAQVAATRVVEEVRQGRDNEPQAVRRRARSCGS